MAGLRNNAQSHSQFQALRKALNAGNDLGMPDGVLINGKGPFRYNTTLVPEGIDYETINVEPGMFYKSGEGFMYFLFPNLNFFSSFFFLGVLCVSEHLDLMFEPFLCADNFFCVLNAFFSSCNTVHIIIAWLI